MNMFQQRVVKSAFILCLCCIPVVQPAAVNVPVYKGELSIEIPALVPRDTVVLNYRTKTREIIRIGVRDLVLTHMGSRKVTRLDDRSATLANHQQAGYWNTQIEYNELNLVDGDYRLEGRITLYLIGSQQTRTLRVYLNSEAAHRPEDSSIDWGVDGPVIEQPR